MDNKLEGGDLLRHVGTEGIAEPVPPIPWLCEGMRIAPGAVTLVAGYGDSAKSILVRTSPCASRHADGYLATIADSAGHAFSMTYAAPPCKRTNGGTA